MNISWVFFFCLGGKLTSKFICWDEPYKTDNWSLWVIDFDGISTHLGLFYAKKLENCVHCSYISTMKQIYLSKRWDPNRYYHSGSEWNWEWWQWRDTPYSTILQNWSLTIRCSLVSISEHPFLESLTPLQEVGIHLVNSMPHWWQ